MKTECNDLLRMVKLICTAQNRLFWRYECAHKTGFALLLNHKLSQLNGIKDV